MYEPGPFTICSVRLRITKTWHCYLKSFAGLTIVLHSYWSEGGDFPILAQRVQGAQCGGAGYARQCQLLRLVHAACAGGAQPIYLRGGQHGTAAMRRTRSPYPRDTVRKHVIVVGTLSKLNTATRVVPYNKGYSVLNVAPRVD